MINQETTTRWTFNRQNSQPGLEKKGGSLFWKNSSDIQDEVAKGLVV